MFYYRIKDAKNPTFTRDIDMGIMAESSYNFSNQHIIRSLEQNTLYEFHIKQFQGIFAEGERPDRE